MSIMDLAARKVDLISWISNLRDEKTLKKIETIRQEESDWWDEISEAEKEEIEKGIAEADRGELIPYDEVMKEVRAKYKLD